MLKLYLRKQNQKTSHSYSMLSIAFLTIPIGNNDHCTYLLNGLTFSSMIFFLIKEKIVFHYMDVCYFVLDKVLIG